MHELGYEQELKRGMGIFDSVAMGFATISPVVGLYAVVLVGMVVAGGAWVWVLPVALAGQCLLLSVYSELAAKWPLSNGAYQWTRRLIGPRYGWFTGWVALCAYAVANTTIAYLGAPWALTLLGITPTAHAIVITGAVLVLVCSLVNAFGVDALKLALRLGVAAEAVASRRHRPRAAAGLPRAVPSVLFDTFGAEALSGGSTFAALLAALAVARLGLHRLRLDRRRRRGDQGRRQARPARGLDRAAERRRARDPQRVRHDARAPEPGRRRRRQGHRPGLDRGRHARSATGRASRSRRSCCSRSSPAAWPRRAGRRAGSTRSRATACCPARASCAGSTAARRRSAGSSRRPSSPGSACCSASRRPRSAA